MRENCYGLSGLHSFFVACKPGPALRFDPGCRIRPLQVRADGRSPQGCLALSGLGANFCDLIPGPKVRISGLRPGLSCLAPFRANGRMTKTDGDPEGTPPSARNVFRATHHSPLTTHHSPLTTHHSPLTTHHSPLFSPRPAGATCGARFIDRDKSVVQHRLRSDRSARGRLTGSTDPPFPTPS